MDKTQIQVLLIEDNAADVIFLREALRKDQMTSFELTAVERLGAAVTLLQQKTFNVILVDLGLPDSQGMDTFKHIHQVAPEIPKLILSGFADEAFALQAVHSGAQDYLVKGPDGFASAARAIRYALERQQAQHALRESEMRYHKAMDLMLEGGQILGFDWRYLYINDAAEKHNQRPKAELLGQRYMDMWPGIEDTEVFQVIKHCLEERAARQMENEFVFPGGDIGWFNLSIQPVPDGVFILSIDITERKQAEKALREADERFRQVMTQVKDVVWVASLDGTTLLEVNQAVEEVYGLSVESFRSNSNNWLDLVHPDDLGIAKASNEKILTSGQSVTEYRILHSDGSVRWILDRKSLLYNELGVPVLMGGVASDITERKRAEEALHETNERFTELANNVSDIFWVSEPKTRKNLYINPAFETIVGLSTDQLGTFTNGFLDVVLPEDHHILAVAREQENNGIKTEVQYRILRPDGSIRWMRDRGWPILDENRKVIRVVGIARDLTEQMEADTRLKESENRFRQLAENITEVFWVFDFGLQKITYISPAYETIWGRTCESLYGHHEDYADAILPEDLPIMLASQSDQYSGKPTDIEYRIKHTDGTIRWIWDRSFPIFDDKKKLIRSIGVATDITEIKKAHKELEILNKDLEERVKERTAEVMDLYDNAPVGYHSLDANGAILMVNQTELNWLGYSREEMMGLKSFRELFTPQSQRFFDENFSRFKEQGWLKDLELEIIRKDGSILNVLLNATAIRDAEGDYVHSRSTISDVTERKITEDALRASEERLNFLLAKTPAIIFTTGLSSNMPITFISDSVRDILGYEPNQYLEDAGFWMSITHPNDLTAASTSIQDLSTKGHSIWESRVKRADGEYHWISNGVSLLRDAYGQPTEIIGYSVDINEQKLAEEALRISEVKLRQSRDELSIANIALEKAARLKDEFLASMSHELRTPLTGILGLSEALQLNTYGPLNERQIKTLKTIEESGRHLLELINDILDLSKIEAGKLDLQFAPCSLRDICQSSLQLIKGMAQQKQQHVHYSPTEVPVMVHADARRLKQILVNLLSNAVKFTPDQGELGLQIVADEPGKRLKLTVWDKGIGIKAENLSKLFTPFSQIDSGLSREYSGTGLGLSLVRHLTELHNGGIEVESTYGEGSRFTISLPWSPQNTTPIPYKFHRNIDKDTDGRDPLIDLEESKIVVADDNEVVLEMLTDFLKANHFDVTKAHSGAELLERVEEYHPDIILVDIQMPGMDGLETIRRIRSHTDLNIAITPVIAVTALAMAGDRERCLNAGADEYISKPVRLHELVLSIRKLIGKE